MNLLAFYSHIISVPCKQIMIKEKEHDPLYEGGDITYVSTLAQTYDCDT